MKSLINGRFVIAALTIACLTIVLLTVAPIRSSSPSAGEYDAWLDWNDDSEIDIKDVSRVARAFGTNGTSVSKASLMYDSGWVDISGMAGQNITVTHGLNITDWNDENIDVSITGKTSMGGELQRYVGLTGIMPGWNRTYGVTGDDYAYALVKTTDGGYALAGYTNSSGAGGYDAWLVKTAANGAIQWNMTYGEIGDDLAYALVQTSDGGYALAGRTNSDFWLVKTDASGTMQWNNTYGGASYDEAYALVQTSDGGYALAGFTYSFGVGRDDFWLVKTDASGTMQWNNTYGGASYDEAYALVQTSDGYTLAGFTVPSLNSVFWLVKTDELGNMMWNKTYGEGYNNGAYALVKTTDGGYALAGASLLAHMQALLVKTDAAGNMQWSRVYGGPGDDYPYALVKTYDDGYALAGMTPSFGAGGYDFWLVKTDASGTMQWNMTYGGQRDDVARALVQTSDGGYALAGYTNSFGAGGYDAWLVKTDGNGNLGSFASGLVWTDSSANTVTLYRGTTDIYWNFVRVRLWKPR